MTYHSRYNHYEWTAFTASDLASDGSLGRGDSFTMPGSATVTMSTWDNDRALNGDAYRNERGDDTSGQNTWIDGEKVGARMYAESYHVLRGSDGKTYYLIEIEVDGYSAPGAGDDFYTFYGATPPAGVDLTVVGTCNVTGCWVNYSCLSAGSSAPPNTPPTFTNIPADGIICIDENTTFVIDLAASDADGDTLTYEIVGGADAGSFTIDANTGELTFVAAPDYENPGSQNGDNTYDVKVKVSDGNGGSETKAMWVKVCDVPEPGGSNCIVIEAENMSEWGFKTVSGSNASGGKLAKLNCEGGKGELWTSFNGPSGNYDLKLFAQDESDGCSVIKVKVNGVVVETIVLNRNSDGGGSDNGKFSTFTVEDLNLKSGDKLSLWVDGDRGEWVRLDKIELCQDEKVCPPGYLTEGFSDLGKGTIVDDQLAGITISAQRYGDGPGSANDAMIFNADSPTGGDNDLGFAGQGSILIISENGSSSNPDDNARGGTITFDFDNPSDLHDIKLLDIEETGGKIRLYDANGTLLKTVSIPATGDHTMQTLVLGQAGVSKMEITLKGSGAVDDLCWKPGDAPDPGSLSGRYFCDENHDDIDNGEPGIGGVTVELLDAAGNGTGITTTTASDGSYSFAGLAPGTYGVRFTDTVSGKTLVAPNVGGDDAIDSDAIDLGGGVSQITGITVVSGADTPDNDAGVEDPGTASLGDRVWIDANGNGQQDSGEVGLDGVEVTLYDGDDNAIATTTTAGGGNYLFSGLDAGTYSVGFAEADGFDFTFQDVGADASDSDADQTTGKTGQVSLAIGEANLTIDAGVVAENNAPEPMDDAGMTCADETLTIDVLANDSDPDSDPLTITSVGGIAITDGATVDVSGVMVSLVGGQLVFDGETAYAYLDIGQQATQSISYTVSDGNGGTGVANVDVTFCGDANSVMSFCESLPAGSVTYQVQASNIALPVEDYAFNVRLGTTGDARLDGVVFTAAYCMDRGEPVTRAEQFADAPINTGTMICASDANAANVFDPSQVSFFNGQSAADNLDLITWILNQDYENNGYTGWEVQRAVWELTDGDDLAYLDGIDPGFGSDTNVDTILAQAAANGEGFMAGVGDIIGVLIDPGDANPHNTQPFIIGLDFETYDCLC